MQLPLLIVIIYIMPSTDSVIVVIVSVACCSINLSIGDMESHFENQQTGSASVHHADRYRARPLSTLTYWPRMKITCS